MGTTPSEPGKLLPSTPPPIPGYWGTRPPLTTAPKPEPPAPAPLVIDWERVMKGAREAAEALDKPAPPTETPRRELVLTRHHRMLEGWIKREEAYKVLRAKNTTNPRVGEIVTEHEVERLIRDGAHVEIQR